MMTVSFHNVKQLLKTDRVTKTLFLDSEIISLNESGNKLSIFCTEFTVKKLLNKCSVRQCRLTATLSKFLS